MARYRFNWENLPPAVLRAVAAKFGLDGPPAAALKDAYGARPKVNFVADAWSVLLDAWLPRDRAARVAIVEELQARNLGVPGSKVKSAEDQLAYLRTCRNSTTLRQVVLTQLILAGEADLAPIPKTKPAPTNAPPTRVDDDETDQNRPAESGGAETPVTTLTQFVDQTLRSALGVSEIHRDDDGDIPIRRGSSMCFVRVQERTDEPSRIILICPLIHGISKTADVLDSLNEINLQLSLGRVILVEDRVVLEAELLADAISPPEFLWALDLIQTAADYFDSKLVARFGGSTLMDEPGDDGVAV